VHTTRNVPSVLSLLELSNPNKRSPIFIYALHLVELTGRASNMLAAAAASSASKQSRSGTGSSLPPVTEHIFNAFENYERHTGQSGAIAQLFQKYFPKRQNSEGTF
jgi:hypothetical protein